MYVEIDYTWQGKNVVIKKQPMSKNTDLLAGLMKLSEEYKDKQINSPVFQVPIQLIFEEFLNDPKQEDIIGYYQLSDAAFEAEIAEKDETKTKQTYYKMTKLIKFVPTDQAGDIYQKIYHYIMEHQLDVEQYIYHEFVLSQNQVKLKLYIRELVGQKED